MTQTPMLISPEYAAACRESGKILADGRQAHITVRSPDWWTGYLSPFGAFERIESTDDEFNAVLLK